MVLNNVSFTVQQGESVCLWGPSGSGKSTLLAIIGGLLRPTSGKVESRGLVDDYASAKPAFAWVMQTANLLPSATAFDNVLLGALSSGMPYGAAESLSELTMRAMGISGFSMTRSSRLSGGQAQRVAVARAIVARTPVILADEPTGQLDRAATREVCAGLIVSRPRNKTVIIATHDEAVAQHCDRRIELIDGSVRGDARLTA